MMRAAMVLVMLLSAGVAQAAVGGRYVSPLGDITLKQKGKKIVGTMADGHGPCGFKKGQQVLKGTLMDDSVTGELTICSEGPGCGPQKVFVVLLVARKGALLSGAVHSKKAQCKLPLGGKGIAMARVEKKAKGKSEKVARAARTQKRPAKKDEKAGRRTEPEKPAAPTTKAEPATSVATKEPEPATTREPEPAAEEPAPPVTTAELDTPFEAWNPEAATTTTGSREARQKAMALAREAAVHITEGRFEAARPLLHDALKQDPGYAEGYNMMGVTFFARDQYDDALGWYKKALTANPDFGDAYYNIACIYAVEGKKELALRYLRIAMLNGYAQADAVAKDPDLDKIRGEAEFADIMKLARGEAETPAPTTENAPAPTEDAPAPTENAPAATENAPAPTDNAPAPREVAPAQSTSVAAPPAVTPAASGAP